MLAALALGAVLAFACGIALSLWTEAPRPALLHLVFAAGVLPLILGAMMHFAAVLTRTGPPRRGAGLLPLPGLAAGALISAGFAFPSLQVAALHAAPPLALAAAAGVLGWILARARAALGKPHPGLNWYLAALAALCLALLAVMVQPVLPAQRGALRLLHLHLNTLGFIGLTALGTLQVLLPTAAGRPDPGAAVRLRRDLPWAAAGVALIAAGAAWLPALGFLGAALLLLPVLRLGGAWAAGYREVVLRPDGAAPSLAAALCGFAVLLVAGAGHAAGRLSGIDAVAGFVVAFLLPLVTGALSQLLPLWLVPGVRTAWHDLARLRLGRRAALRALLFLAGGLALTFGWRAGLWLALAGLVPFLASLARVLLRRN